MVAKNATAKATESVAIISALNLIMRRVAALLSGGGGGGGGGVGSGSGRGRAADWSQLVDDYTLHLLFACMGM